MKEFHCIVGNKGGVGKSLVASWVMQYAEDQRWGPVGIECDQSNRTSLDTSAFESSASNSSIASSKSTVVVSTD